MSSVALCSRCGKRPRKKRASICNKCNHELYIKPKWREKSRRRQQRLRTEAIQAYGGVCVVCGENDPDVLVFDHVKDDGADHRRKIPPASFYAWLRREGYPPMIQLLCANDNMRKERKRAAIRIGSSGV